MEESHSIGIGEIHTLRVLELSHQGAYLDGRELGRILLPSKHCPAGLAVAQELPVFLYLDANRKTLATTLKPKAVVGEFAYLKAVSNSDFGTFLDWGLDKDLLAPFGEQHRPMEEGRSYIVHVHLSKADGRIIASSKIDKFLKDDRPHQFVPRQAVNLIIANSTELGFKAIVEHSHWGVLYKNEVTERLSFGQHKQGFIKHVRPDGKIDLTLKDGQHSRDKEAQTIVDYLIQNQNFAPIHDKSDPAIIERVFHMSKRSFKKAIGGLYKQGIINIGADGIRLIQNSPNG